MKQTILSGIRPTGKLHLGHLVGALSNWAKLQNEYECYFMVADWHALMGEYENPSRMPEYIIDNVADWLSVGIDPAKSNIFIQSQVTAHLDLYMIFSCFVPLGWLERCPTYKEQLREVTTRDLNTYGFLGYPVLQAADILVYRADKVPVGEDQIPHLELSREIARRFHGLYAKEVFPEPQPILTPTPRLLGLDGRKMSKSYDNAINLSDSQEIIFKKVASMITDPERVRLADKGHPDVCNVFSYYSVFAPDITGDVRAWCEGACLGCTECKKRLAGRLSDILAPLGKKRESLLADKTYIQGVLREGGRKAAVTAGETLEAARKAMGL